MTRTGRASTLAALLVLGGCVMGPNYHKPVTNIPPAFRDTPAQAASFADLPWWEVFRDQELQRLIRTALEKNYDVRIATEQIEAARAQVTLARSALRPQVTGSAAYSGGKDSTVTDSSTVAPFTADVSYQVDLFGGLRRASEAARAQLLATEEARRTVVMTLVSDVAVDYYQLLALDLQLRIARDTLTSQEESLRLTELRVARGVATRVDVLQAQQVLDAANAQVPSIERQIGHYENAMSLLTGGFPDAVPRGRTLTDEYLPPEVPAGLTSALLERRPDIRRAEQQLVASNAEIGVARAAFFPQIALTGSFGASETFIGLMSGPTSVWTYTAALAQPIFRGGALRARLRASESAERQALLAYMQTVHAAFGDVANALVDYRKYRELRQRQDESVRHLNEAVRLGMTRYRGGITTYLEVLDQQRSLFSAQLALAQARGYECQSVVALYRALGGGWKS